MQNVVNMQIANIAAMQQQSDIVSRRIDQDIEMLHKEVLQSFASSAKAGKTPKDVSERKGKEV
jgi:hypothetical protein